MDLYRSTKYKYKTLINLKGGGEDSKVKNIGNHLYFYTEVNDKSIRDLNILIKGMTDEILSNPQLNVPIFLHINSKGGDYTSAIAAHDTIKHNPVQIMTIAEGSVASGAAIMYVGGHKRFIMPNATILFHHISGGVEGSAKDMKRDMASIETLTHIMKKIYSECCGISDKELNDIIDNEVLLDANQCIKHKIADKIIDPQTWRMNFGSIQTTQDDEPKTKPEPTSRCIW